MKELYYKIVYKYFVKEHHFVFPQKDHEDPSLWRTSDGRKYLTYTKAMEWSKKNKLKKTTKSSWDEEKQGYVYEFEYWEE